MILDNNIFKPINTFGTILTVAGFFGVAAVMAEFYAPKLGDVAIVFLIIMSMWHLISGFGILVRKRWGFIVLKVYLYILILGFPIGTTLAIRILSYVKENEIEKYYR